MIIPPPHSHAVAILRVVLDALNVDAGALVGTGRHPKVVLARRLSVYLMRKCTILSFPEIGHAINPGRAYSSVVTMVQAIERDMDVVPRECNKTPRQWIAELMPVCQSRVSFTKSDRLARR